MSEIPLPGPAPIEAPAGSFTLKGCLTMLGVVFAAGFLLVLFFPPVGRGREAARRSQCKNNLKQIALALHNYHDKYSAFPPAYTVDADGKPLHSWRTLILPYLEETPLYNSIDLTRPWDDPVNEQALKTKVAVYACPSTRDAFRTVYLANASQSGCFRPGMSRKISEITDGMSNTILILEVPEKLAVPWMSPQDADEALFMAITADSGLQHMGGVHAALSDGAIRFISANLPIATRRALLTIEAGEKIGDF